MTGERTVPGGAGLLGFWTPGSGGFAGAPGIDDNWRKIGAGLCDLVAESRTTDPLPVSPGSPVVYIVAAGDATNPNKVAVWDGPGGSEAWVYYAPYAGLRAFVKDAATLAQRFVVYDGSAWVQQPLGAFRGFRAHQTSGQSISNPAQAIDLHTVTDNPGSGLFGFDTEGIVDLVNNRIEVTAALDGAYGAFSAGLLCTSDIGTHGVVAIQQSIDNGASWLWRGGTGAGNTHFGFHTAHSGPVRLKQGDWWRAVAFFSSALTTEGDHSCFFSGEFK